MNRRASSDHQILHALSFSGELNFRGSEAEAQKFVGSAMNHQQNQKLADSANQVMMSANAKASS